MRISTIFLAVLFTWSMASYGEVVLVEALNLKPFNGGTSLDWLGNTGVNSFNDNGNGWVLSFNMSLKDSFSFAGSPLAIYSANKSGSNSPAGNAVYMTGFDRTTHQLTLAACKVGNTDSSWFGDITVTLDDQPLTLVYESRDGSGSTLSLYQGTTLLNISGTNGGSKFPINKGASSLWTDNGLIDYSDIQFASWQPGHGDTVSDIWQAFNVPEPATASLSLLGLTVLSFRRRR